MYFYLVSILNYKKIKTGSIMGNCYAADHIDHTHINITCNIEEPQQKYRLGTVSNRLLKGVNTFYWIQALALSFYSGSKHLVRMKVS